MSHQKIPYGLYLPEQKNSVADTIYNLLSLTLTNYFDNFRASNPRKTIVKTESDTYRCHIQEFGRSMSDLYDYIPAEFSESIEANGIFFNVSFDRPSLWFTLKTKNPIFQLYFVTDNQYEVLISQGSSCYVDKIANQLREKNSEIKLKKGFSEEI